MRSKVVFQYLFFGLIFLLGLPLTGQEVQIEVGKNIQLGKALTNEQFFEPYISAHPTNPNKLLGVAWVVSTLKKNDLSVERCAVFSSEDAGLTWKRNDLSGQSCSDAWITSTEKGGVLTTLAAHPDLPNQKGAYSQAVAYFSNDGGKNWSEIPQSLGFGHDGPRSTLASDGSVYITSHRGILDRDNSTRTAIYIGRASKPSRIAHIERINQMIPSNLNFGVNGITTLSDGTLAIIYQDFQRHVKGPQRDENGNWRGRLEKRRDWLISSTDGGLSFSFPKMITETCYARANDLTTDKSNGPYRDRLYTTCIGDNGKSVLFMYSKGEYKGGYWSDARAVELPDSLPGERRYPHIAVNKNGIIALAWLDNRDKPGKCISPYIAISTDGGTSFSMPVRVGNELSCPTGLAAGKYVAESNRWSWGGDYFGLTAAADGRFHLLWPDARSGKFELITAVIRVE